MTSALALAAIFAIAIIAYAATIRLASRDQRMTSAREQYNLGHSTEDTDCYR